MNGAKILNRIMNDAQNRYRRTARPPKPVALPREEFDALVAWLDREKRGRADVVNPDRPDALVMNTPYGSIEVRPAPPPPKLLLN